MKITVKEYSYMVKKASPNSTHLKNCSMAFLVGGLICSIGELLFSLYSLLDISEEHARMLASATLILTAALLTGIRLFPKIAKYAGAGTLVPITGFANAVVSPAIEFKNEGIVLGTGSKMLTIAGPVIVYGTVASVIYGIIYYIVNMI